MVQKLTTQDQEALALQDAYAEDLYKKGVFTGGGLDLAGTLFDFLGKKKQADLLENVGKATTRRGKDLQDAAGEGAEQRLADARGQKQAFASGAAQAAAQQAVMDPTGAGAAQLGRDINRITQAAGDVSKEQTAEMQAELNQLALGEKVRAEGEQQKLVAKQEKAQARLGMAKGILEGIGKVGQALKPADYETAQSEKALRQEKKQGRLQKRLDKKNLSDKVLSGEMTSEEAAAKQADFASKIAKSKKIQTTAESNVANLKAAELKKTKMQYGSLLANPFIPEETKAALKKQQEIEAVE
tara:strand:- start:3750 stop:4646 length:897 start_codon:yes stop_codon:yes gene_type:complete